MWKKCQALFQVVPKSTNNPIFGYVIASMETPTSHLKGILGIEASLAATLNEVHYKLPVVLDTMLCNKSAGSSSNKGSTVTCFRQLKINLL